MTYQRWIRRRSPSGGVAGAAAIVLTLLVVATSTTHAGTVLYVDDNASPGGDGETWETAFRFLHDGLGAAMAGDEIRVAQGLYLPDRDEDNPVGTGDRASTFQMLNGIALLGGYAGIGAPDPDERDPMVYESMLDGDLLGNDGPELHLGEPTRMENANRVVTGSGTDATAVIDGFTITGGHADGVPLPGWGAGLFCDAGSPAVRSCRFTRNVAVAGGAMYVMNDSEPTVAACVFIENLAGEGGAALIRAGAHGHFEECRFIENDAGTGGAITVTGGAATIRACTFDSNAAGLDGGAGSAGAVRINASVATLVDCTFVNNHSNGDGGALTMSGGSIVVMRRCLVDHNTADTAAGVSVGNNTHPLIIDCDFTSNRSVRVGGCIVLSSHADPVLIGCRLLGNVAGTQGGALLADSRCDPVLVNCVVAHNTAAGEGGAIIKLNRSTISLRNSVVYGNRATEIGGGVYGIGEGEVEIRNSILWANEDRDGMTLFSQLRVIDTTPRVAFSCVQGLPKGFYGPGTIDLDPLFVDPDGPDGDPGTLDDDFRLLPSSPCIDAGNNWGSFADVADLDDDGNVCELVPLDPDGQPRFADDPATADTGCGQPVVIDIGAWEVAGSPVGMTIVFADINGDGSVGFADLIDLLTQWGVCNGCCLADLTLDGEVGFNDLLDVLGAWGPCT